MKAQTITAAGLLFALRANADTIIASGKGFGTYYYDVEQQNACNNDFGPQNTGFVECSLVTGLSLNEINSQYLVAMNNTQLAGDMATYCGKRVVVSVNGVPSDLPLFIGDGCQRCGTGSADDDTWDANGAPGLDFSYSVLNELSQSACSDGHIDISWEIVDDTLFNFDTDGSGGPQGHVGGTGNGSGGGSSSSSIATSAASSTPTSQAPTSSPSSINSSPEAPAPVPNTLIPVIRPSANSTNSIGTASPTISNNSSSAITPTSSSSGPCETGAWQCNVNVLEQCLNSTWTPRITCDAGSSCRGGSHPYCAPEGYSN